MRTACGMVLGLLLPAAAWAQLSEQRGESPVPAFLPRSANLGLLFNGDAIGGQARVTWEVTLVQQRISSFILIAEGGGGYGLKFPQSVLRTGIPMTYLYQYTAQGGAGYRARYFSGLYWGFQATIGALFYGARFNGAPTENGWVGSVEGYLLLGYYLGRVAWGVRIGVVQALDQPIHSGAVPYAGGFALSLFGDWR